MGARIIHKALSGILVVEYAANFHQGDPRSQCQIITGKTDFLEKPPLVLMLENLVTAYVNNFQGYVFF
jgi:hypothetical protein